MNRFIAATPSKCIGCRTCEVACVLAHAGDTGVEGLSPLTFMPRLTTIKTRDISVAVTCHHCDDAPCVNACPCSAIVYRNNSVQVEQDRCIGCKTCMVACPFGAMNIVTVPMTRHFAGVKIAIGMKALAQKCDLCSGRDSGPACASVCPTKALQIVDRNEMNQTLRQRQTRAAYELVGEAAAL
ncbi:4Fe-4S dicluster domain-containing protein [Telmatospirillum sp.]|uniref:4Fe-4S dicluster domain-containing protein n=1 Tax=Telmatospirillum sp. TaxID=2079197 RepID=UPI002850D21B|nr:4Fe-4S dicluster domain-containing protein [Telmatospirillum sp.]MDR3438343.1 4Fe-4S dicluster domain-containing protein [Telmatospirillum sp.]